MIDFIKHLKPLISLFYWFQSLIFPFKCFQIIHIFHFLWFLVLFDRFMLIDTIDFRQLFKIFHPFINDLFSYLIILISYLLPIYMLITLNFSFWWFYFRYEIFLYILRVIIHFITIKFIFFTYFKCLLLLEEIINLPILFQSFRLSLFPLLFIVLKSFEIIRFKSAQIQKIHW